MTMNMKKIWKFSVTVSSPIFQMMRRQPLSFFFRLRVLVEIFIALFHLNFPMIKVTKLSHFVFLGNSLD